MLRRIRRTVTDTVRFCEPCSQVSTADHRAERHYQDHRVTTLILLATAR